MFPVEGNKNIGKNDPNEITEKAKFFVLLEDK